MHWEGIKLPNEKEKGKESQEEKRYIYFTITHYLREATKKRRKGTNYYVTQNTTKKSFSNPEMGALGHWKFFKVYGTIYSPA